ncbi:pentapeptide repeat-containing protein [Streptomyces canus]|uniref:pentapeptide repeat-containing protein n=1 Tax=Streptomyces canus TaxID=58343 RepID=UPI00224F762A|nr:pentapeptide repeat-containing protein [Streptomyces canus]MCX5255772.1 pentapeptide repeat-containing protein [Streptomyces canus]
MIASLPGLAALLALLFTWMQVTQTNKELALSEQGQITNRFTAAINNLGSASLDIRLGGIYALGRIMNDSARDEPTVIQVLSAYLRQHAALPAGGEKAPAKSSDESSSPRADIQAVITVLGTRRRYDPDRSLPFDLSHTVLRGVQLTGDPNQIHFSGANLEGVDLNGASLHNVDLWRAWLPKVNLSNAALTGSRLDYAVLAGAKLTGTDLTESRFYEADLTGADLTETIFCTNLLVDEKAADLICANLTGVNLADANLTRANLDGVDLINAKFCPDPTSPTPIGNVCARMAGASFRRANLKGTYLSGANLRGADLTGANLTGANLANADLKDAKVAGTAFSGANLNGVRGIPPSR